VSLIERQTTVSALGWVAEGYRPVR